MRLCNIEQLHVNRRTYHSRNTPEGVGQHIPIKPRVAQFLFEEQDSEEIVAVEAGDEGDHATEDEFEPELGTGTEYDSELAAEAFLSEKPFRVAIQYNSWLLLRPGSSFGLETAKACAHAAFGSPIAWFAMT